MKKTYIVQIKQGRSWFDSAQNYSGVDQTLKTAKRVFGWCKPIFHDVRIVCREFKDTVVWLMLLLSLPLAASGQFHGVGIDVQLTSTTGQDWVYAGETVLTITTVRNVDEWWDSLTVTAIRDSTETNQLPHPITLPSYGDYLCVTNTFTAPSGYAKATNIVWVNGFDNYESMGGYPLPFTMVWPASIRVVEPTRLSLVLESSANMSNWTAVITNVCIGATNNFWRLRIP